MHIKTSYAEAFKVVPSEEMVMVVPLAAIKTANYFNYEVYESFTKARAAGASADAPS
ncbi:MAG: hypothetical protein ACK5AZ_16370 [Bryobacteraceae bacterium]